MTKEYYNGYMNIAESVDNRLSKCDKEGIKLALSLNSSINASKESGNLTEQEFDHVQRTINHSIDLFDDNCVCRKRIRRINK